MDGAIATGDDDVLAYGDFAKYVIADRVGTRIELIPHLFSTNAGRPTGQRGWFAYYRAGADVVQNSAFKLLVVELRFGPRPSGRPPSRHFLGPGPNPLREVHFALPAGGKEAEYSYVGAEGLSRGA